MCPDSQVFWRRGILFLAVCLSFGMQLGRSLIFLSQVNGQKLARHTLDSLNVTYTLVLTLKYMSTYNQPQHSSLTWHLCSLTLVHLVTWYIFTFGQALSLSRVPANHWSEYASFILSFIQLIPTILIPLGPELYQDPCKMYNSSVTAKLMANPSTSTPNVIGDVSSTILGKAMFSFVFPVIIKTAKMEQVDIDELPLLASGLRTQNIIPEVTNIKIPTWVKQLGSTWEIIYLVWAPQLKAVLECEQNLLHSCRF